MTVAEDIEYVQPAAPPVRAGWTVLRERWALVLMLICAGLIGPVGYGGQLGYAALIGVAGLASLPMLGVKRPPILGLAILLLLALWSLAAMSWSAATPAHVDFHRYKNVEQLTALKLVLETGVYGAFVFLMRETPSEWADRIMMVVAISLILCLGGMCVDALTNCALYRWFRIEAHAGDLPAMIRVKAARGCYTIALLFWPAAVWMWRRGWAIPTVLFGAVFAATSIGLSVDTPVVAVVLGGLVLFAVARFGRTAIWVLLAATIAYFALAPMIVDALGPYVPAMHDGDGVAKESWGARVQIWRFVAARIVERPWLGWGMDASRVWPQIPLHPHNAALQVWFELGVVGAALAALFWAWLWARIGTVVERGGASAGIAAAVAVAYLTIGALSFGVWQEWWLALGAFAVAVCLVFFQAPSTWTPREELQELIPLA